MVVQVLTSPLAAADAWPAIEASAGNGDEGAPSASARAVGPDALTKTALSGSFTENLGQLGGSDALYYLMGDPLSVAFGRGWVGYDLRDEGAGKGVMFKLTFEGANDVSPTGVDAMGHVSNFFIGNDPAKWVTGARSFQEIVFPQVYEGIDLTFKLIEDRVKYEFLVAPGANAGAIAMRYEGIDGLGIEERSGDLLIRTACGLVRDSAPITYTMTSTGTVPVGSGYRLNGGNGYRFWIADHDDASPLVIDPALEYSTYFGSSVDEWIGDSVLGEGGDLYIDGSTTSPQFALTAGAYDTTFSGANEGYVCKFLDHGKELSYSTYLGGNRVETVIRIMLDDDGNMYVAGYTNSTDFPVTTGAIQKTFSGGRDCFAVKLNPAGDELLYGTYLGGSDVELLLSATIDVEGCVYLTGRTYSSDFPTVAGSFDTALGGTEDIFVSKIDTNGTKLLYSTYVEGWDARGIDVDDQGCAYVVGGSDGSSPITSGAFQGTYKGAFDGLAFKLDSKGAKMLYCTYIGSMGQEFCEDVVVDETGEAYILGETFGADFPTTDGAFDTTYGADGSEQAFLLKLNGTGGALVYSTFLGGTVGAMAFSLDVDGNGTALFALSTYADDMVVTDDAFDKTHAPMVPNVNVDFYLGVLDCDGAELSYGTYLGGIGDEWPYGRVHLIVDQALLVGGTQSPDFPVTDDCLQGHLDGDNDNTITKLNVTLPVIPADARPPSEPWNLTATPRDGAIDLKWEAPRSLGNLSLRGYRVYRQAPGEASLTFLANVSAQVRAYQDMGLTNGKTYEYAVSAYNRLGDSPLSQTARVTPAGPPSMPLGFVATAGCGTVQLSWTEPEDTGGLPVLGYRLLRSDGLLSQPSFYLDLGNVTGFIDTGLENGRTYRYIVGAFNAVGNGTFTEAIAAMPRGPPAAPTHPRAVPSDGAVTLEWRPPQSNGGSNILRFSVYRAEAGAELAPLCEVDPLETSLKDTAVRNGVTYFYAVSAVNVLGESPLGPTVNATPRGPPGPPMSLVLQPGDGQVTLAWERPDFDGGSPITVYQVYRGGSADQLQQLRRVVGLALTDTGLTNGLSYFYNVAAVNGIGEGPPTATVSVTPMGLPGPPEGLVAEGGVGRVTLTWSAPVDLGGGTLQGYKVYRGEDPDTLELVEEPGVSSQAWTDMAVVVGRTYHYAVAARTLAGEGPRGQVASAMPYGPPGAPRNLTAVAGNGRVTLAWEAPADDGSSPVTGYIVLRGAAVDALGEVAQLGAVLGYVDTEVENGRTYHYSVRAANAAGKGDASALASAVPTAPIAPPGRPRSLMAEAKGAAVVLSWTPPATDGGSPITGYVVLRGNTTADLHEVAALGVVFVYTDTGVERGRTYYYKIVAVNAAGQGEPVEAVEVKVPERKADDGPGFGAFAVMAAVMAVAILSRRRRGA